MATKRLRTPLIEPFAIAHELCAKDHVTPQTDSSVKVPNTITRRAMQDASERKNLKTYASVNAMLKDLGL